MDKIPSWEVQTENIMNKLFTKNATLRQLLSIDSCSKMLTLFLSKSQLLYGILVGETVQLCWRNCTNIKRVLVCQQGIICMMFSLKLRVSCIDVFIRCDIRIKYILEPVYNV